ncbi:hypothetical protein [Asticcacaulis sp.]|uniref:hypothetical protein n=1 Tax=Asticcacaulis sp. TaxID=1872648 RepID=UPI003F7BCC20
MSDASLAATVGGAAGALFGALSSAFQSSWIESRKRRADQYNKQIDEILTLLKRADDLGLRYWTSEQYQAADHVALVNLRSEIYAAIKAASREQNKLFDEAMFLNHFKLYYQCLTGGNFGSRERHKQDLEIPLACSRLYNDCKDYASSCRYRWSIWNIIPGHGVR